MTTPDSKLAVPHSAVEEVDIALLKPYWRNPRQNDEAVEFVTKSIQRYGFQVPIIVDDDFVIVSGHVRYRAALKLVIAKVPVIRVKLSPERIRQFRIADNKVHEYSRWDDEKLTAELTNLNNLDAVTALFGDEQWTEILSMKFNDSPPDGAAPAASPAVQVGATPTASAQPPVEQYECCCPYCGKVNVIPAKEGAS